MTFDAHGSSLNGNLVEPFGYKAQFGYYTDNETGLQLLTHRYYDSSTGRFVTRDPISYAGGINLYSHVANNPVNLADPSGLDATTMELFAGGLGSAGLGAAAIEAAPVVIIVGGIFIEYYAFWRLGECIAEQPWNPLTHPSDPRGDGRVIPGPWPGSGPVSIPVPNDEPIAPPAPPPPPGDQCVAAYEACLGWANQAPTPTEKHLRRRLCGKAYDECKAGGATVKFPHGGVVR